MQNTAVARGSPFDWLLSLWFMMLTLSWAGSAAADQAQIVALASAISRNDVAAVQALLDAGVDPNADSGTGRGPMLCLAARDASLEIVRLLLDKGADPKAGDRFDGRTALHQAAGSLNSGRLGIVELLLARGAHVDARDKTKKTALMSAAGGMMIGDSAEGNPAMVRLLLDKGADVNAKDSFGKTALIYAAAAGNLGTAQLLMARGADINVRSRDGLTALMAAESEPNAWHQAVARALLAKGAVGQTWSQRLAWVASPLIIFAIGLPLLFAWSAWSLLRIRSWRARLGVCAVLLGASFAGWTWLQSQTIYPLWDLVVGFLFFFRLALSGARL
jgi:ankyrin repeat protein